MGVKLFLLTLAFALSAQDSLAKEFNYDTYGKYDAFKWNEGNCGKLAETLHKIADNLKALDLSYLQKSQWTCENLGELRSAGPLAIGRINEATKALASFQDNCMCNAYVALRLKAEGYDSARSGGEVLNFGKATALYNDARTVSEAIAPQLDILSKFDQDSRELGKGFCKKDSPTVCTDPVRYEHCGQYDVLKEVPIPTSAVSGAYGFPVTDVFHYLKHVGGRAHAVRQKTERGIDSLTDFKGPAPYCQNTWGDPKSCPPKTVNNQLPNGFSSKLVWDACGKKNDASDAMPIPDNEQPGNAVKEN